MSSASMQQGRDRAALKKGRCLYRGHVALEVALVDALLPSQHAGMLAVQRHGMRELRTAQGEPRLCSANGRAYPVNVSRPHPPQDFICVV